MNTPELLKSLRDRAEDMHVIPASARSAKALGYLVGYNATLNTLEFLLDMAIIAETNAREEI